LKSHKGQATATEYRLSLINLCSIYSSPHGYPKPE